MQTLVFQNFCQQVNKYHVTSAKLYQCLIGCFFFYFSMSRTKVTARGRQAKAQKNCTMIQAQPKEAPAPNQPQ